MSRFLSLVCAGVIAVASTMSAPVFAADSASFKAAFDSAQAARKRAAAEGFEWRDTRKLLKKASKAAKKGDFAKAEELAMQAKFQGEAAYAQSQEQESAWKAAVVR